MLSNLFGECIRGNWKTHIIATLRRPAAFQQEAIQTLLYACKMKDLKTHVKRNAKSTTVKAKSVEPEIETEKEPIARSKVPSIKELTSQSTNTAALPEVSEVR